MPIPVALVARAATAVVLTIVAGRIAKGVHDAIEGKVRTVLDIQAEPTTEPNEPASNAKVIAIRSRM